MRPFLEKRLESDAAITTGVSLSMTPFPSADQELAELERFLQIDLSDEEAADPEIAAMRHRIERLSLRIANPVRVALLGLPGSGKTSLAAFLGGHVYEPVPGADDRVLPVILRHGTQAESSAGWWSGVEVPQEGVDFKAAADLTPDYVELRVPNPILQFISFLDMPGENEWSGQKEQVGWIAARADVILWCTNAADPWLDDEWQLWSLVPKRVQERSLLVATHLEQAPPTSDGRSLAERLGALTRGNFHSAVAISTLIALEAAPSGKVADAGAWEKSGGRGLVGSLLSVARAVRKADLRKARDLSRAGRDALKTFELSRRKSLEAAESSDDDTSSTVLSAKPNVQPQVWDPDPPTSRNIFLTDSDDVEETLETDSADEASGAPDSKATDPDLADEASEEASLADIDFRTHAQHLVPTAPEDLPPMLRRLAVRVDGLVDYASQEKGFKDWEFMAKVADIGDELSAFASERGALSDDAKWIQSEIDDAYVSLSLLQVEHGEKPCIDAATILLQLVRDLSWACANREVEPNDA